MVKRVAKRDKRKARKEKNIIAIATEGNNRTEETYFKSLNRRQNSFRFVFVPGNYTDPVQIVSSTVKFVKENDISIFEEDKAYAVFDVDFGKNKELEKALRHAAYHKSNGLSGNIEDCNPSTNVYEIFEYVKYTS